MTPHSNPHWRKTALSLAIACTAYSGNLALAQENDGSVLEEILVTSEIRSSIRNSMELKRESTTIVDALASDDMGALPDLSVAETLERITGVTGDRFKGNASEISVRGLGPFLGFSTFNGREVSSGSGNRSVAFSQFPSELVNGAVVYKAQQADLVEGGVSGIIDLQSMRPLDFGQRRVQAEVRANYSDYHAKLDDKNGLGYRGSVSYTDVFDTGIGDIGIAFGYARHDAPTPEESYNTSSELRPCNSDYVLDDGGSGGFNNCSFSDDNAAANGGPAADGDYFFVPNLQYFRQMESEETRDAAMLSLQWQPNDQFNINLDTQWSNRWYYEDRRDLYLDDGRNNITNWETNEANALTSYTGFTRFGTYNEYRERDETYKGAGLNIEWQVNDRLLLDWDLAYSDTVREQDTWQVRFRSPRAFFDWQQNSSDYPSITAIYTDLDDPAGSALDFDFLNDHGNYTDDARPRYGLMLIEDTVASTAFNGEYFVDGDFISSIKAGVRYSEHDHNNFGEDRWEQQMGGDFSEILTGCATDFPQRDYGSDSTGTIGTWATFDGFCAFNALAEGELWGQDPSTPSSNDIVLTETITAAYVMAQFGTYWGDMPVDGNFGVRVVNTENSSVGYRQAFEVEQVDGGTGDPDDDFITVTPLPDTVTSETMTHSYTNILPSVNVSFGLTDDVQLRLAAYRALSRPDMWWLGAGRDFTVGSGDFGSLDEALAEGSIRAEGNPRLEALESDNFDVSVAWYPTDETMFSVAYYLKSFQAGFDAADPEDVRETFVINDIPVEVPVQGLVINTGESSTIQGIELTAQHAFTHLPEPFDGLGVSASFNYADTDFEYRENGALIAPEELGLAPAKLPGFSRQTYNVMTYWEKHGMTARLAYKYRSEYLKPFGGSLAQTNRFVEDHGSLDLSLAYRINSNFQVRFEALGLDNSPYVEYRVAEGANSRVEYSGRRYFLGLRYRM